MVSGLHGVLVEEARTYLKDADAEAGVALHGVVGRNGGDNTMHMVVHPGVVDLSFDDVDAEGPGGANRFRPLAGREQRLGRHATIVEAIAAHAALLDEDDRDTELSRGSSHGEAPRPCADHAEVRLKHLFHVSGPSTRGLAP